MQLADVTEAFLRSIDIHTILPQQEPFVMVGKLVHFELRTSTTETVIREDNFTPCGIMENMAQTCASRIGFYNKYILEKEVQIGYIGAIRDFVNPGKARAGSQITTTVDVVDEVFGMTLASATVKCQEEVIATAQIVLAVKNMEL